MTTVSQILVDYQKVVEVSPFRLADEDGETHLLIPFENAHDVLNAWKELNPAQRDFRYGRDESDGEPSTVIVIWSTSQTLYVHDIDPFWDGVGEINAYRLEDLAMATGDLLLWGERIGEEEL